MTSRPQDLTDDALGRRARLERAEPLTPSGREERLDLDALEKVALATEYREWVAEHPDGMFGQASFVRMIEGDGPLGTGFFQVYGLGRDACKDIADHIATFDPPTVLRLIAAARHPISSEDDNAGGADTARAGEWKLDAYLTYPLSRDDETYGKWDDDPNQFYAYITCESAKRLEAALSAAPTPTNSATPVRVGGQEVAEAAKALEAMIMLFLDGDNEGEHGGDHYDDDCPTCQVIIRAADAYQSICSLAAPTPTQEGKEGERSQSQPCAEAGTHIPPSPEAQRADGGEG